MSDVASAIHPKCTWRNIWGGMIKKDTDRHSTHLCSVPREHRSNDSVEETNIQVVVEIEDCLNVG